MFLVAILDNGLIFKKKFYTPLPTNDWCAWCGWSFSLIHMMKTNKKDKTTAKSISYCDICMDLLRRPGIYALDCIWFLCHQMASVFGDCVRDFLKFCRSSFYGVSIKILFARYLLPEFLHFVYRILCSLFISFVCTPGTFVHFWLEILVQEYAGLNTVVNNNFEMQTRWVNSDQLIRKNHCQMVNV